MIYVVASFVRSGSTGFMSGCVRGGMDAAWSEDWDKFALPQEDGYELNPGGKLYEVPWYEYKDVDFPLKYQRKLIKLIIPQALNNLGVNREGYRFALLTREPAEWVKSHIRAFGYRPKKTFVRDYWIWIERFESILLNRRDVLSVLRIPYAELCKEPERWYARLNWPLDPVKAATAIDKSLRHTRQQTHV